VRRAVLIVGGVVLLAGLGLGLVHTRALASEEVDLAGEAIAVGDLGDDPLVRASLQEGQAAYFEVCSEDRFDAGWDEVAFEVWHLGDGAVADRKEAADWAPRVQRGPAHGCVVFVSWESLLVGGEYGIRLAGRPETDRASRVQGRMMAVRALGQSHKVAVALAFLGGLLLFLGFTLPAPKPKAFDSMAEEMLEEDAERAGPSLLALWVERPPWLRVLVALILLIAAMVGLSVMQGTFLGMVRALLLALIEIALAVSFLAPLARGEGPPTRAEALGLTRPRPGWWIVALVPLVGVALWIGGAWLSRLVPSTGLSPVEAFVSHPSGALALAVVAVIVPIAEELFFRGFVYGALARRRGALVAGVVTVVVFAVAHLPQQWGAWGPFLSVTVTGLVLTVVRATTRSIVPSVVAHLTHNGLITLLALA
jgi:membrane protease YdiL (CAAX protease family)